MPCECGGASISSQCDADNGACICQPGVTGHKCQSCISGYWNYADTGCQRKLYYNYQDSNTVNKTVFKKKAILHGYCASGKVWYMESHQNHCYTCHSLKRTFSDLDLFYLVQVFQDNS
jgi:hypothetical protein